MQVPHIFSPGFPSKSGEVNENFAALAAAITALESKVAALEGTNIPTAGNYFLMGFQTGLMPFGQQAVIEGIVYTGPVTLFAGASPAGGAATLVLREAKNELHLGATSSRQFVDETATINASWTWNSTTGLALILPDDEGQPRTMRFARAAPRLHIGNHLNAGDGSSVMLFLVRQPG
jgi:hypothetical protein